VLSVVLRTAAEWDVITGIPCALKLLRTSNSAVSFYDVGENTNGLWKRLEPIRRPTSRRYSGAKPA
jgi:hypothetical protein